MAREIILKVGTQESVKNVADLRTNISLLKEELSKLDIGSNEYQNTLKSLQANQAALRNAMHGTASSMTEVTNAATGANVAFDNQNRLVKAETLSYNELVRELDILKQQWRATTNAAERNDLAERINSVNNRLKQMDASVGTYGRNVGNYIGAVDHLTASFGKMGAGAQRVINPIRNATGALQVMSKTPVIAILGILANLLTTITKGLKSSEENTRSLANAMNIFAGAGDFVKNVMQGLGAALTNVINSFSTLLGKIFPQLQAYAEGRKEITEEEIELINKQRLYSMKNAEDELRIQKARQEAADKFNHSAQERIEKLEYANYLELEISKRNQELAQMEYDLQEKRAKRAQNSREENDKLAAAYVKMKSAETEYYQSSIRTTSQLSSARKEMAAEAETARKKIEEARRAEIEALDAIGKEIDDIIANQGEELLEQMDKDNEKARDKVAQRLEIIQQGIETRQQWNEILTENEREQEEKRYQIALAGNQRIIEALQDAYTEAMQNGDLEAALDYEQQIADKKVEIEMDAARRIKEVNKQAVEDAKEAMKARVEVLNDAMGATASIFDSLADIYDSNTKKTKAEAERVKNLRIAAATIDMLQGVVTAISSAQELGPIAGPIMAAINSAAVIAAGVANINKIKSTQISTSGGTSAVATAPTFQPPVTQVRNLTTSTEEDRLNQMASSQRVYILSSDLEADSHSRRARVTDTTF